jgi:N-acetylneuraminic acid mutarotase
MAVILALDILGDFCWSVLAYSIRKRTDQGFSMEIRHFLRCPALAIGAALLFFTSDCALAQGTAFSYRGQLSDGGKPATGLYDLKFVLYDALVSGNALGVPVIQGGVLVSGGVFSAVLDFGPQFSGASRWLEVAVRTNGASAFTTLMPRQPLLPTPYAVFANTASNLAGLLPASQVSGVILPAQLPPNLVTNQQVNVTLSGTFAGNGGGLSNLNASAITGTIAASQLAAGAVQANLLAAGQSAVPGGGVILSTNGADANLLQAGYLRLGPVTLGDNWRKRVAADTPTPRYYHTAVWTGSEMIVWGGNDSPNTGAKLNPFSNTWRSLATNGAPTARGYHTAVWTGTEMIVWGGAGAGPTGGRYNPVTDAWTPVNTNGAPAARWHHTAVWTGSEMIVWGGAGITTLLGDGARYDPKANAWSRISSVGAPGGRWFHAAAWTGSEMIIWGGDPNSGVPHNSGGRYDPKSNSWKGISSLNSPAGGRGCVAFWTGTDVIYWSSSGGTWRYSPTNNSWVARNNVGCPSSRAELAALWTGHDMVIWGGEADSKFNDGLFYTPALDSWRASTLLEAPSPRWGHSLVWTGDEMIVFGGVTGQGTDNACYSYWPSRTLTLYLRP